MSPKNFQILGFMAAFLVLVASISQGLRDKHGGETGPEGNPLFIGLMDIANEIHGVVVRHADGALTMRRTPSGWAMEERANYPVDPAKIRRALIGMAQIEKLEPKTNDPERYGELHLRDPGEKGSRGREIMLYDKNGERLGGLVVGKSKAGLGQDGGAYVRRLNKPRAWLVKGAVDPGTEPRDWLVRDVADITTDRIARVVVAHPGGHRLVIEKADKKDKNYTLKGVPKGKEVRAPALIDAVAGVLANLQLDDVAPEAKVEFKKKATVKAVFSTFGDMTVTVSMTKKDDGHWIALKAEGGPGEEAEEINERAQGWVYRIPSYKAAALSKKRDDLIKAKEKK